MVLCTFLAVCILFTSTSQASNDIDPCTYDWENDPNDGWSPWNLIDSSGNANWFWSLVIRATTNLDDSHCKTDDGTKLEHHHYSSDLTGQDLIDANRFWDWFYSCVPGIVKLSSATNTTNCLCYAMDGYAGSANYDYWVNPGHEADQGNTIFADDCSMRLPPIYADIEVDDRLAYWYYLPPELVVFTHVTIVNSESGNEPTEIEWKNGHSGAYKWDNSSADDQYSTPGCDITKFDEGEPPEGEYNPDYEDGGFGVAFYD